MEKPVDEKCKLNSEDGEDEEEKDEDESAAKHPFEALKEYRQQMNLPETKLVVMAMTSTEFTIADHQILACWINLIDEDRLHRAKIHPISVLLASATYSAGHGLKGGLKWVVNEKIKQALDKAFILAFKNVIPTNQRYCLALDVSGSMGSPINGGVLSCRDASAAMSALFLRTEQKVVHFVTHLFPCLSPSQSNYLGLENRKEFDVFIVFTDCETWCGEKHPFEALKEYRQQMNLPETKLVKGMLL
uniref:TROVE domain-containing protein n=1 Tax=Ditylenchus dipsaci TaxID=166011 RepID=A0A915DXL5_9BILA